MQKTDNELLREGYKSYHKALFAVMEFRRQVRTQIGAAVEKRLAEIAAALHMDEDALRGGLGEHADPANFNQEYKGDGAEVGLKTPRKWPSPWILYFYLSVGDDDPGSFNAAIWLKDPGGAIKKLESLAAQEGFATHGDHSAEVYEHLPPDGPVDLSAICNRVLDEWIDLWKKVGGLRQFLPK